MTSKVKDELMSVFDVMTERLPKLISSLKETLFSEEAGRAIGKGVAAFYKELLASGMPVEDVTSLTRAYMSTLENVVKRESSGGAIPISREHSGGEKQAKEGTGCGEAGCR